MSSSSKRAAVVSQFPIGMRPFSQQKQLCRPRRRRALSANSCCRTVPLGSHNKRQIMSVLKRGCSQNYYIQFRIAGRTIIRSARTADRRVAEQLEMRIRSELHAQIFLGEKPRLRLEEALSRYARQKEGTPNHTNIIGHISRILGTADSQTYLDELGSDNLERLLQQRRADGVKSQTIKHCLSVIKGTIKLARSQRYRVPDLEFPAVRVANQRLRYLTVDEERRLLLALDPKRTGPGLVRSPNQEPELRQQLQDLYDLVILLLDTGARCSEIRRLQWDDIDLELGTIRLWRSKVGNEGLLYMTARSRGVLVKRRETATSKYVFTNKIGGMRNHPHAAWRKAFNRAGLRDCTIHTLRHTHASRLIQNGMSLYDVQTVLGHTDPRTTMRYAHLEKAIVTAKARAVIDQLHDSVERR